ncbi:ABC transporter ATP-binding protein [Ancylobacter pratisalsi]|uniref:ABC transporter ATP-binding protein n=1 Tax=Ancylobacter pratisalsi TaxID=1745854 RepID=A0A6P1YRE9_9HYPH|nr:ABC transporter ATP-binding protein [Ancylobacter pratisalsi]
MAKDLLRIENLRVSFAVHGQLNEVVKGVSLRVPAGRTVALVGESGSGKTVISQSIMGLLPPNGIIHDGRILFADPAKDGKVIDIAELDRDGKKIRKLRGGRIGMIFQEPMSSLSPVHTIGNQIEEALQLHRPHPRKEARAITEEMLGLVGFRDPRRNYDQYPFELSGGLRQRAMLAMALICRPALLIADEPTTALDVTIQAQVLKLMKTLQGEMGMAILLITHDLGVVANVADEVVVVYRGRVMEAGPVDDIFRRPQHPYLKALLKASPDFDMPEGERLVALRDVAPAAPPLDLRREAGNRPASTALLNVRNLRKTYGSKHGARVVAVENVSFDIMRGHCFGLVGESGSGKTTVGNLIMRARTADSGSVIFNDRAGPVDVMGLDDNELRAFRPRMQMIFQDPVSSLSPRMTVLDIIREPMIIQGRGSDAEQKHRAVELMECVGLDPRFLSRYPHSFSGGQRQRIGIARALALNPDLIICDEPVSALDVSVQAQVLNLLKDLQASLGLTYLFVSHNLAVVHYMATQIAVMARGRIVEIGPRDALFHRPAHPYTRSLLKAVPLPDLDRKLDFDVAFTGGASDPVTWPEEFRGTAPGSLEMLDLGGGHFVLADRACTARDVTAA